MHAGSTMAVILVVLIRLCDELWEGGVCRYVCVVSKKGGHDRHGWWATLVRVELVEVMLSCLWEELWEGR